MIQLYNVWFSPSTHNSDQWQNEMPQWLKFKNQIGGNPDFNPLTIKAFYVAGIILAACRSVTILIRKENHISTTFYPAYIVFASAVELLGRCINGNQTIGHNTNDLKAGFQWLGIPTFSKYETITGDDILIRTRSNEFTLYEYTFNDLIALRNYSAHGQAMLQSTTKDLKDSKDLKDFDYLILGEMPPLIGSAIEGYLNELRSSEDLANRLARVSITPYRNVPISDILWMFQADANSFVTAIGNVFRKMDWSYKSNLTLNESSLDVGLGEQLNKRGGEHE